MTIIWENVRRDVVIIITGILIGWLGGWIHAHKTVESECRKLGSFYVGETVFKCVEISKKKTDQ